MLTLEKARRIYRGVGAARSATTLLFLPERIQEILKLGDYLAGTASFELSLERALADPESRELIRIRYQKTHPPLEELEGYPSGTLGQKYAEHMRRARLQAYTPSDNSTVPEAVYLKERSRIVHDVWHVVLGYGTDIPDEAALNSFILAQIQYPISALIVGGSILNALLKAPASLPQLFEGITEGWNRGLRAKPLLSVRWEEYWGTSLSVLRSELRV